MSKKVASEKEFIDVLDRVLDKGIVIDAWMRVSLAGIDLITIDTRVIVTSIDTYLNHRPVLGSAVGLRSNFSPSMPPPAISEDIHSMINPVLFIVAANKSDLFETWITEFAELAERGAIILDRRRHERRQRLQPVREKRRRAERRTHKIDRELELFGVTAVATTAGV